MWWHAAPGVTPCTDLLILKLVRSKRPRSTRCIQKLGPRNPTSYSTRTKSAQGLATSQQLNLRMKLYILNTYIVYLWPPDSLCSSLEARGNVDAFLATRRGPTSLRSGAQYKFSSSEQLVVLIPYCANNSRATFGVGLPRYAPSLFRGRTLRLEQVV